MLAKFEVEGFKNFKNKITLDLSNKKGYEFNEHLVVDGIAKSGVVFGKNASGKSNLGMAIFDIINHLTDKEKGSTVPYLNLDLDTKKKRANFKYEFKFNNHKLVYEYSKVNAQELLWEKLYIDNDILIDYNYLKSSGFCRLEGTETLINKLEGNAISYVKYINNNSVLDNTDVNITFKKFISFVDNMLLFYSLENNHYRGYYRGSESISHSIVLKGKLNDFEEFLNNLEIPCKLESREVDGQYEIFNVFENGTANFFSTASTGTRAIALYYYWLINAEDATLIFMDEFDAYYHFELSKRIVEQTLKRKKTQILFTSHNTNLMDNNLFRPDCLFIMQKNFITCMSDLTEKELRKAHNLQKMYKAGAFNG